MLQPPRSGFGPTRGGILAFFHQVVAAGAHPEGFIVSPPAVSPGGNGAGDPRRGGDAADRGKTKCRNVWGDKIRDGHDLYFILKEVTNVVHSYILKPDEGGTYTGFDAIEAG